MAILELEGLGILSTEHSASSHGIPVLIIGDKVLGPEDMMTGQDEGIKDDPLPWLEYPARVAVADRAHGQFGYGRWPELIRLFVTLY